MSDQYTPDGWDEPAQDPDAVEAASVLRLTPQSVGDALEAHVRLQTLESWISERRASVRAWAKQRADERRSEDAAAPTWRMPEGTVLLTDPRPKPRVKEPAQFACWYVEAVLGESPHVEPHRTDRRRDFDAHVTAMLTPRIDPDSLHSFLQCVEDSSDTEDLARYAADLASACERPTEWYVSDQLLPGLLDGSFHPQADGRPRFVANDDGVWDLDTGEQVPGVVVDPPGPSHVQFRATQDFRHAVRAELDRLLGQPELTS